MDAATKARAFEPFFTTKPVGKGTGLGLATVHGIAKQSGGHVEVYSEAGQGTTFKLYLPLVFDAAPKEARPVGADGMLLGSETILVAEDDDAVRAMVLHILRGCGYRVIEAYNGTRCRSTCQEICGADRTADNRRGDAVSGGRELAAQIAATHPACKMLFLSGMPMTRGASWRSRGQSCLSAEAVLAGLLARKVRSVLEALP
jgi:CheY-like chemotaxis protein